MSAADLPDFAHNAVNLASAGLGATALGATDDFFAEVSRMLADAPAVFYPDRYDDHGKWMDGWESRRRRGPGHDYAVVRLAAPGTIAGVDVDTSHFTGNYPPAASLEACAVAGDPDDETAWTELVPMAPLGPSAHHHLPVASGKVWTHVRLHIYPDGGVARLRVYGTPHIDVEAQRGRRLDLASGLNGGASSPGPTPITAPCTACSPRPRPRHGRWLETRRRRTPGNDWLIVALGARGLVEAVELDTAHYKGNFPTASRCSPPTWARRAATSPTPSSPPRCSGPSSSARRN